MVCQAKKPLKAKRGADGFDLRRQAGPKSTVLGRYRVISSYSSILFAICPLVRVSYQEIRKFTRKGRSIPNDAILPYMKAYLQGLARSLMGLTLFTILSLVPLKAENAPLGLATLLPGGARSSALANCSALLCGSAEDFLGNPALVAGLARFETGFGIDIRTDGLITPSLWLGLPLVRDTIWIGVSTRILTASSSDHAHSIAPDLALPPDLSLQTSTSLGLAWRIAGSLAMGAAFQVQLADGTNSRMALAPAMALGLALSRAPGLPLAASIAFLNIVPTIEPDRGSAELPWIWRASAAWRFIDTWAHALDLGFEWSGGEDRAGQVALGLEYVIESRWALRTGLAAGDAAPRFGLGYRDVSPDATLALDLSWQYNEDNGNVLRISIALGF